MNYFTLQKTENSKQLYYDKNQHTNLDSKLPFPKKEVCVTILHYGCSINPQPDSGTRERHVAGWGWGHALAGWLVWLEQMVRTSEDDTQRKGQGMTCLTLRVSGDKRPFCDGITRVVAECC